MTDLIVHAILLLTVVSLVAPCSSGAESPQAARTQDVPDLSQRNPQYRLHINDLLEVNFDLTPELNQTVRIGPDGYISLRAIPAVYMEGQTVSQAVDIISKAYAIILHNPAVAVILKEYERPSFIATGEVQKPGKYDLGSQTTAMEGVAIAGGFNADAKHSKVVLFRQVQNGWIQYKTLDLKHMLNAGNMSEDIKLQPGDLIFIPKNTISKVSRFIPNFGTGVHYNPGPGR